MRAAVLLIPLMLGAAACSAEEERPGGTALARLTVRVDPDGPRGPRGPKVLELRCDRPEQSDACGAAASLTPRELAPVPAGRACTQLYGGPQTATIRGDLRGRGVDSRFSRTNGCEVARWNAVRDLLDEVR